MSLVFDTDVLSTFGKIKRLDLLRGLFPNAKFFIPPSVYNELFKARERGYEFVDYVIESRILEVTPLNKEELEFLSRLREERRSLGLGELEGVSICKHREYILVTNDITAKKICDRYEIEFIDLSMILKSLLAAKILTSNEVRVLITEIERKDRVTIKDRDDILTESGDND
jgi:predicted nucleic acid-binding protein